MGQKGGPPKRGNKIYLNRGGVKAEKLLPMQQKDRLARGGEVAFDEKGRRWAATQFCLHFLTSLGRLRRAEPI